MAEIGIERFRAGHRQKHGAECDQADQAVVREKVQAIKRVERASTPGSAATCPSPAMAMAMNQRSMIGPKKAATRAVPCDWKANSTTRMTTVSGTT